ncbi:MAG: T9SS type A sorting domain-containing protein [Saprospiraceae bacterium]
MQQITPSVIYLLCAAFLCPLAQGRACGYDFVGGCSSRIFLSINGTLDSFSIASCPDQAMFDGLRMGRIKSIQIASVEGESWESCHNNVCYMQLHYRVRPKSNPAAALWQSLPLNMYHHYEEGDYTTRFFRSYQTTDLSAGLTVGVEYVLELYLSAAIDTLGDDFIPEIDILQNNFGENFLCSFVYAPDDPGSMSLFPRILRPPQCHGDATGRAEIGVYGVTSGLFFYWSDTSFNFFARENLPAGVYTLSVTNSLPDTAVLTFEITQPEALSGGVGAYAPLNCGTDSLRVKILATGGSPPLTLAWDQEGQIAADSLFVVAPGPHHLILADANGCEVQMLLALDAYTPPEAEATTTPTSSPQASDGAIALQIGGGNGPHTVLWANGQSGSVLQGLPVGLYCYTVSDAFGCEHTGCAEVPVSSSDGRLAGLHSLTLAYPNPAPSGGEWFIASGQAVRTFALYDASGRLLDVSEHSLASSLPYSSGGLGAKFTLRLRAPECPGIYFFRINHTSGILYVK